VAVTIDPGGAQRRREAAEQLDVRVRLWREQSGAAAIAGRNLPTDEALAAYASVNARTAAYKKSKAFPGASMDQLRAMAYLDLLNGITADDRIASARAKAPADPASADPAPAPPDARPDPAQPDPCSSGQDRPPAAGGCPFGGDCRECDGSCLPDDSPHDSDQDEGDAGTGTGGPVGCACRECDGSCVPLPDEDDYEEILDVGDPHHGGRDDGDSHDNAPDDSGPDNGGPDGSGPHEGNPPGGPGNDPRGGPPSRSPDDHPEPRKLTDLVIPLLTLLGLVGRPGEGHGLGPLDPALCRDLAAAAANSPRSQWCVTLTDPSGFAIGHGCARLRRGDKATWKTWLTQPGTGQDRLAALPSQVNLTIPAAALPALAALTRPGSPPGRDGPQTSTEARAAWGFAPRDSTGTSETGPPPRTGNPPITGTPPETASPPITGSPETGSPPGVGAQPGGPSDRSGYGTWTLTLPGGRNLTVVIEPVPTHECDHREETHGYEPSDKLRHLVQVRDGECTFPPCSRHAKETDFEHVFPYHKGGRTCACNAGARSRKCHRIKQSPGWNVTQPEPGWHQWTTPSGRVYTQEPKRYPS
jgi:hypothetical protein